MSNAVSIDGIVPPDSDLARKAAALAESVHTQTLINHAIGRTGSQSTSRRSGR
jgi:hypothetical protein